MWKTPKHYVEGLTEVAGRRVTMPSFTLLDPDKTGRQAQNLENSLRHLIVGQDEAIHQIVTAYQTHLAGLSPVGRPVGNFLFLGPTGSGKTGLSRQPPKLC
jgi:ATP-dependent Clp protease ATP-binding subunit ClpA